MSPNVAEQEPFIPRIRAFLTENYAHYKQCLDRIKFIGAFLLITTTAISFSVAVSIKEWNRMNTFQCKNTTDCMVLKVGPDPICEFTKQFDLPDEYRLSVCNSNHLDLRRYVNNQSSVQGITINRKQFDYILRISSFVYRELNKHIKKIKKRKC